ncbi:MAG: hypothetical protein PHG96_01845 [Kiritimatiellae bacterium]|nr:hypothetical protein [Kiritimatiellia bacterium]
MVWCARPVKLTGVCLAAAILILSSGMGRAGDKSDADRWLERPPDEGWRALAERWQPVKASMTSPVENLLLPLDHFPNGRVRAQLAAEKAQVFADGIIFAEGVKVALFNDSGAPDGCLTAEGCIFDRNTKNGYCEGPVSMEKDGDRLKGRGMYFSFERQSIIILSNCEIRTRRIRNNFGRLR